MRVFQKKRGRTRVAVKVAPDRIRPYPDSALHVAGFSVPDLRSRNTQVLTEDPGWLGATSIVCGLLDSQTEQAIGDEEQ